MTIDPTDRTPMVAPLAELERHLIAAYLAGAGCDLQTIFTRDDIEARRLLAAASSYASATLTEVEARCHYLDELHGKL